MSRVLCALADLPDPGAKGPIRVTIDGEAKAVFVVRVGDILTAWIDSCPHLGAPLEMEEDRFLDLTGGEIICAVHGARFHPETGACLWGPCRNGRLTPYPIRVVDGSIVAAV
ncbi:Rieske 2Fe-2S domain-containing protein [Magnetospirillum sp. UT-4]|uniref:Rieske (2Fe-2S) protein n=1 Tax=Magnetospirillum sp. UT-4 TaxID=2681467 RepID=UPI00137C8B4A|nr:Rieske 2Fe-2S domain-containing protein [Magnetospirillum sp. UT-4]CAA7624357.1 Rieske (2Fe-2S) domain protein [Magnetospirillum sp. UT-4]